MMVRFLRSVVASLAIVSTVLVSLPVQAETFKPGWRFNPPPGDIVGLPQPARVVQMPPVVSQIYLRQSVPYATNERVGTIIIDSRSHFLYLVIGNGHALRYGIGVARAGFEWRGTHRVSRKAEWPSWTPPAEMRLRQPGLPASMAGGIDNPLGARALYLGSTLYRIHGTNEPWTIGQNVSSGCIRMTNDDVIDLYARVEINAKVIVF